MKEVKQPRRPMLFYYIVMLIVVMAINFLLMPSISQTSISNVDYGTFMKMTEQKQISKVEVQASQILFEDAEGNLYRTSIMEDPGLTERL